MVFGKSENCVNKQLSIRRLNKICHTFILLLNLEFLIVAGNIMVDLTKQQTQYNKYTS